MYLLCIYTQTIYIVYEEIEFQGGGSDLLSHLSVSGRTDTGRPEILDDGEGIMFVIYHVLALSIYLLKGFTVTKTHSGPMMPT